jgi:ketosteroid isomerase-like protein
MASARELIEGTHSTRNARDLEGYRNLGASDLEMKVPGGSPGTGPDGLEALYAVWQEAFADNHAEILSIISDGNGAALEGRLTGTHTGAMRLATGDIPPTGRRVSVDYALQITEAGGRMVSYRLYFDRVEFLTQLGLMPEAAAAGA